MLRKARFRGSWYPYDKTSNEKITGPLSSSGDMKIAVLPHAGLIFSGNIIRGFFERIPDNTENLIIISPSHYFRIPRGRIIVSDFTEAETPFGTIPVTTPDIPGSIMNNDVIAAEHGLEMFLPFAGKKALSVSFCVINALNKPEESKDLARVFQPLLRDGRTIFIASSDFTHYGKRFDYTPYSENAREKTIRHDRECAMLLSGGNGSLAYEKYGDSTICGIAAAAIAAETAALENLSGCLGESSTSCDITGDEDDFVSYQSVMWR